MAQTLSTMKLNLGDVAPSFRLLEPAKKEFKKEFFSLADAVAYKGYLIIFMCNHCPFVIHLSEKLKQRADEYMSKGLLVVGINSNDVENYPEDSPEKMIEEVKMRGYNFPYLFDEHQEVAKKYYAACTPDFFLFDEAKKLVYKGQFDDSRPGNAETVSGRDVDLAVNNLLAGGKPIPQQKPSIGCNIKWKPGQEPDYFG